jgi:hypothetical protein
LDFSAVDDCLAKHQLELHFDAEGRLIHRCGNCKPPKAEAAE